MQRTGPAPETRRSRRSAREAERAAGEAETGLLRRAQVDRPPARRRPPAPAAAPRPPAGPQDPDALFTPGARPRPAPPEPPGEPPREGRREEPPVRGLRTPTRPAVRGGPLGALVLTALAGALVLWSLTAFVDSGDPVVHLLAALCPLVTVLALPIIALSTGRRHLVPAVVAGLAALVPWIFATGYAAAGPGPTQPGDRRTFRLMVVDAGDGAADVGSITRVAREQGVDGVVVTGLTGEVAHDLAVAGLNRIITTRWVAAPPGSDRGAGVWTREGTAELSPVAGSDPVVYQGRLQVGGTPLELVVAQPGGSALAPGPTWRDTLDRLGELPALEKQRVLVGNLNATVWHPAFRALRDRGWVDAADVTGRGLRPTWPSWSPLPISPLDHILVDGGIGGRCGGHRQGRGHGGTGP